MAFLLIISELNRLVYNSHWGDDLEGNISKTVPTLNFAAELGLPMALNKCPVQALKNDLEKWVAGRVVWGMRHLVERVWDEIRNCGWG